ncbi:MAG: TonB-dependent receptor [Acidobacteria bacterium]|nr:TonB-dependent receptor [Acidobacteriota bacterium]
MARNLLGSLLLFLTAGASLGQQSATLSGTAMDSSGAVVARVSIRIANIETGETYTATSNDTGAYTIPLIKPGAYELTAEASGFKQFRQRGIVLETGVPSRVDVQLEVGGVNESVTVEAATPQLRTETSSVGAVIRHETIANMPLIGRRAAQLARLNGFMVQAGTGSTFAMAGGRGDNANWTIDGGNAQNILLGVATLTFDPPIDSLEEFNVEISNYKAELGRTGGGVVQMTTKSGTNNFHGTLYEFLRNDALDARNFFSATKPVLRYNQFGGSLGGRIRRDRTFFFANYEGIRRTSQSTMIASIPSAAERAGNFSAQSTVVRDPLTGGPFAGNVIPASRFDPVGKALADFYPDPNVAGAPSRNNNYRANQPVVNPSNVVVTRIDHSFVQSHRVYGRYLTNSRNFTDSGPIFPTPGVDSAHQRSDGGYHNWSVTYLHNFAPATIGEFRWQWDWRKFHNYGGGIDRGLAQQIGLKGANPRYFPRVNITGVFALGSGEQERRQFPIRGDNLSYTLTKIQGKHTLKFGGQYRRSRNDDTPFGSAGGVFSFTPVATGDAFAALLLGWPVSGSRDESPMIRSLAGTLGLFAQTDWRVTPKLTLNLGLRWDLDWPRHEGINNQQNSFDQGVINPICNCPGALAWSGRNGRSIYAHNFDFNNFGPRIGFAYRATDKWVIRGGGSIIYTGLYDNATPLSVRIGFSVRGDFVSPDGGRTAPFLLKDGLPPVPPISESNLQPGFGAVLIGLNPSLSVEFFEPNGRVVPYLETFNLNVQRQITPNMLFEIGYLGTMGHKLVSPSNRSINQVAPNLIRPGNTQVLRPFPQYSDVRVVQPAIGNSKYHGMNLKFDRRMSGGLQFNVNYTWAKAIDDVEARNELGGNAGDNAYANQYDRRADKGLSGNHVAHRIIGSTVWDVPVGQGRALHIQNKALNLVAGGWSTGWIIEVRGGTPFGVIESNSAAVYPTAVTVRSNAAGPYRRNPNWRNNVLTEKYFDSSVFLQPAFGTFGNLGRTVAIGPGAFIGDLSILKDFAIAEGHWLQFRCEMLNFANHASFNLPNQSRGVPAFGTINSLIGGNQARITQFGLHYRF